MTLVTQSSDILVEKEKIIVTKFETTDKEIVSYFQDIDQEEQVEKFENALKVGVVAVRTVGITEKIDYIQKEFNQLDSKFKDTFGAVSTQIDNKLEETFGEEGKFSDLLKKNFGEDGKIMTDFLDPNKKGTPFYDLKLEIQQRFEEMKEKLGISEAVEQIKSKTTLKGFDFEEECESILANIAKLYGDHLERTSKTIGKIKSSKKGDFVITLGNANQKIVLELKGGEEKFSASKIYSMMDESIKNREADYGIFVVSKVESVDKSIGWFNEYGNYLVCALGDEENDENLHDEILCIAYKWARTRIIQESLKKTKIDGGFIREKMDLIKGKLDEMKLIRNQCGSIQKSSEEIKTISNRIEGQITDELDQVLESMKGISEIQGTITSK
jgi:hypothetical protein